MVDAFPEPTVVPPVLLDLCSVAVLHRFSSPSWLAHVEKHVAARMDGDEAFNKVARLKVIGMVNLPLTPFFLALIF